jgi:hypothetical protein
LQFLKSACNYFERNIVNKLKNMSFTEPQRLIRENDTAILYISINNMHAIKVTPEITNKIGQKVSLR